MRDESGVFRVALKYNDGEVKCRTYRALGRCIVVYDDGQRHEFIRAHRLDDGMYVYEEVEC